MNGPTHPLLSVIVPVRDGEVPLVESLTALRGSDLARDRWELIVVDDGSSDRTAEIAGRYADQVLRLEGGPRGPAFARNRGVEAARGEILVFVDADVCVHRDALSRLLEALSRRPDVIAVFGSYDASPRAPGLVSQYRNLLHHYVHSTQPGDADTFWAGLGAVKRGEFVQVGGFDEERYPRPQIEDIELGYRLRSHGYRIVLDPAIQGTHLKRWTLPQVIRGDVFDRGAPWMGLLLERRAVGAGTLNIGIEEKVMTGLAIAGLVAMPAAALTGNRAILVLGGASLLAVLAGNAPMIRWFARVRGPRFAAGVVPLRLLYYVLNGASVGLALARRVAARARGNRNAAATAPARTLLPK